MAGVNVSPDYLTTMGIGYDEVVTKPLTQGGIVCIYYLGTSIGTLLGGWISDHIGRIKTVLIGCFFVLLGASLQTSAQNVPWILCARIVTGMGTGIFNGILPVWSAETSHPDIRGALIAFEFSLNYIGIITAYWLEYGLGFVQGGTTSFRWRFPLAFQLVPAVLLIFVILFLPESPRWLVKAGREEDATIILARLRSDGDVTHPLVLAELASIKAAVQLERKTAFSNSYFNMVTGRGSGKLHIGRRVQLATWLLFLQAWTGITTITVYSPYMFTLAGYGTSKSQLLSGLNTIGAFLCSLIGVVLIDRIGRRIALWWGSAAMAVAMILEAVLVRLLKENPDNAWRRMGTNQKSCLRPRTQQRRRNSPESRNDAQLRR